MGLQPPAILYYTADVFLHMLQGLGSNRSMEVILVVLCFYCAMLKLVHNRRDYLN
jgi:hypothetical protein